MNRQDFLDMARKAECKITIEKANEKVKFNINGSTVGIAPLMLVSLYEMKDNGVVNDDDLLMIADIIVAMAMEERKKAKGVA